MTAPSIEDTWIAPGPGLWERDAAHQERPFCALLGELLPASMAAGTAEACARMGIPLQGLEAATFRGWAFVTLRPLADEHFTGRLDAAEQALAAREWRVIADEWYSSLREIFSARNRELLAVIPDQLDDHGLAAHLDETLANFSAGLSRHLCQSVAHWVGVGLLALDAEALAGWSSAQTVHALAGASPASMTPVALLGNVAARIAAEPSARELLASEGDPSALLATLRDRFPAVAAALDDYLDSFGWQVFTGFDFTHQAIVEMPDLLLATIRNAIVQPGPSRASALDPLLGHASPADRARLATVIDDAVVAYGLRDDDSAVTVHVPTGIVRRALLAAGRRLAARGAIHDADDIFDASGAELGPLLTGDSTPGMADQLARRAALRRGPFDLPPLRLGEDEPPPEGELPGAMGVIMAALVTAMGLEEPAEDYAGEPEDVCGVAASPGIYEGTARIVKGEGDFERLQPGDVLVASSTTPAYNVVLPLIGAVVTDRGGVLSHPAIVAREFGIPAVVGTRDATTRLRDGGRVRVDGGSGTVTIL